MAVCIPVVLSDSLRPKHGQILPLVRPVFPIFFIFSCHRFSCRSVLFLLPLPGVSCVSHLLQLTIRLIVFYPSTALVAVAIDSSP